MNSFGRIFRISIFGESHGPAIGVVIDGVPAGLEISKEMFEKDLERRRSGQKGTTERQETDIPEIISGIHNGITTGSPVTLLTRNRDRISSDYGLFGRIPRPGHADYVAGIKYSGNADLRGGGHFSGRITWGLVAGGVIAREIIKPAKIQARLISAGGSSDIEKEVAQALEDGDSVGGIIECVVSKPQKALGEPFFYSFESAVSQIIFSIPAIKGIEFGAGFKAAGMKGSDHNDRFIDKNGKTDTNNSGGINGGITNGNDIIFRIAVKPTSSIKLGQMTFDFEKEEMAMLKIEGRHDACIALRMPVIVEAATAIAMADLLLIDRGINQRKKDSQTL